MEKVVNVVGAGLAGLASAIALATHGFCCNLISKDYSERSQSVLAEGGINASLNVMGEDDSPFLHFQDTMKGGAYLNNEEAVKGLTENAPKIIEKLVSLGVPFNMEGNHLVQRNFGGQKKKRTAFAKSSTGKIIMTSLIDEARKYEAQGKIKRYPHHSLKDVILEEGVCKGVVLIDNFTLKPFFLNGPVILALGGLNGFFPEKTTGTTLNDGNAQARLFHLGVSFMNLEFIQYHPTTVAITGKRMLITEAARGEGGRLYIKRNHEKWYFMEEKYPELKNLMPRDVVSREMYNVVNDPNTEGEVYLDMSSITKDQWENKLSDLRREIISWLKIDPAKEDILVSPGIHFFMGGIYVDNHHKTNMERLYAAGECASIYHGANRLGGNSLLGAIYGGIIAAKQAMVEFIDIPYQMDEIQYNLDEPRYSFDIKLRDALLYGLSIIRDEKHMEEALEMLLKLKNEAKNDSELERLDFAFAMVKSAKERKESRGAHYRRDYPSISEEFHKNTIATKKESSICIEFKEI